MTTMTTISNPTVNTVREATARLLATENITVIQDPKATTAYFDLKTRTLGLPVWKDMSNEMYDMLVGHEVSHALFTPNGVGGWVESAKKMAADAGFSDNKQAEQIAQSYLNIVEDARIERLIKDKYPGLRRDFFVAYSEFAKRDIFKIQDTNINALPLCDRLNIHFKIGFCQPVAFTTSEMVFVNRIEKAITWQEVVEIATDLFKCQTEPGEQKTQGQNGSNGLGEVDENGEEQATSTSGTGNGNGNDNGTNGKGKSDDKQNGTEGAGDADGSSKNSGNDGEGEAKGKNTGESKQMNGDSTDASASESNSYSKTNTNPVMPEASRTEKSLDQASSDMRDAYGKTREYYYIPKLDSSKFVIPVASFLDACRAWENGTLKTSNKESCHRRDAMKNIDIKTKTMVEDTRSTITTFVREFEMLKTADEHRRTIESKSGRLDMKQAWKYKISDNLFRVATSMKDGKSHGFVLFIDWSGSMSENMEQTMRQLYIMFQFCRKVGVPFDVYAFGIGMNSGDCLPANFTKRHESRVTHDKNKNEIQPSVELLHILSSRSSARDLQDSFRYCLACALSCSYSDITPFGLGGSTPLDSTIVVARDIVNDFHKQTKVQIVNTVFLTDGDATDQLLLYGTKPRKEWNSITVLRDGTEEWTFPSGCGNSTNLLLDWFRAKTLSNIVGIFVASRFSYAARHLPHSFKEEQRKAAEKSFKTDGWVAVPGLGFDEYFILRGNLIDTEAAMTEFEQKDGSTLTPTQIKNAYIKAVEVRNNARGMVRRLVEIVA